ncbi:hypothetical protein [Candidatus Nitrotoga sp. BS]|uniref:hypothetical protein n=1 Tax=Candidatus Nitrotoga sp. BS TaxID=2890408 RepID=UPI001EF333CC|nr:hypothetical protein [Candidatus Nitrotoga sp. BS]
MRRQSNVLNEWQWVKEKRISWRAFVACTDTKTPHKLSGQSAIHVAWTSKFPAVKTTQPPVETSVNTKNIHDSF